MREKDWQPLPRPEKEFIKLNANKAAIVAVLKMESDYRPPTPIKYGWPPSSRCCDYHEDIGDTTELCFQLSYLIESKFHRGQLVHQEDTSQRDRRHDEDRVIHVIFGGIAAKDTSNNSRKQYAREVVKLNPSRVKCQHANPLPIISFSDNEYHPDLVEDHQDALVITTRIGNNIAKKLHVDNGSSVASYITMLSP
ncbi:uncharacterized protein LOC141686161 [Apium graveolens]|uniref:uncharacterized protein LOC141686161 n=1 Tax=Apium graveolens TaxID=4045 RepID=UPI003D79D337